MKNTKKNYVNTAPLKEIKLYKRVANGDEEAFHDLVNLYSGFAINVAKGCYYYNLEMDDLKQIALETLLRICKKYDYTKSDFKLYASVRIKRALQRASKKNSSPLSVSDCALTHSLNIRGMNQKEIDEYMNEHDISSKMKKGILNSINASNSLNATIREDSTTEIVDTIKYEDAIAPDDECIKNWQENKIQNFVHSLEDTDRNLISSLYGLNNQPIKTGAQIASELGITRQAVSFKKKQILNSLKNNIENACPDLIC